MASSITDAGADAAGKSTGGSLIVRYQRFDVINAIVQRISSYYRRAKSLVYDTVILRLTEKWYRAVLEKLNDGSILLDVGVGTGGALLRCVDLIESKNLKVIGIDIDAAYVEAGKASIRGAHLSDRITIDKVDVYEGKQKIFDLAKNLGATRIDAVYFSGSFSLLPDPVKALQLVSSFVEGDGAKVYITQTYQRKTPFFLPYVKPLLKYATTIDFGQLVKEGDVLQTFNESGLEIIEHGVIPGSVDNRFQAAYLSILR